MTRSSIVAAAASAAAAVALGLSAAAPASLSAAQAPCGTFNGPVWTQVNGLTGQSQKGTTWKVIARSAPCSFAKTWAKKLVRTPFKGEALTKLKSPKGWTCIADGGLTGGGKGTPGHCNQGSKTFAWTPALPS